MSATFYKKFIFSLSLFAEITTTLFATPPKLSMLEIEKLTASDATTDDYFGHSVPISDDGGSKSGSAYLYKGSTFSGVNPAVIMYLFN